MFATLAVQAQIENGYYNLKNKGNGKYIKVLGRKTVGFVSDKAGVPGCVYKVKAVTAKSKNVGVGEGDDLVVDVLRSQGVDLPGYAKRAMNYVPTIVDLVVEKLKLEGEGELFGTTGLDAIMDKFKEGFDYNLYVEPAGTNQYRIYGKTPSMTPVKEFYVAHKTEIQVKLPMLEGKINEIFTKVLNKTGGKGSGILLPYSIHDVWAAMGGTLTEPVSGNEESILAFYDQVLTNEDNIWNFAYYSVMPYWERFLANPTVQNNLDKLGSYADYLDKIKNIQPNFRYYIVANGDKIDFISQGNKDITENADRTIWTVEPCESFTKTFDESFTRTVLDATEYYTTFYADFAYTLPENGKAYKITDVNTNGVAIMEEITGAIPAQTPVLLMTTDVETPFNLTLSTDDGTAITDNLLQGPDYLIKTYQVTTPDVESLFNLAKDILGETFYQNYLAEYEYLKLRTAGTVNNKYFFGLDVGTDLDNKFEDSPVRVLGLDEDTNALAFIQTWGKIDGNEAYLVNEDFNPVKFSAWPDVTMDGAVDTDDVTALINICLAGSSVTYEQYDYDAADVDRDGDQDITDVTKLIDIILHAVH